MSFRKNIALYLTGLLFVVGATGGVALLAHARSSSEARETSVRLREVAAGPHVIVTAASQASTERKLELQAEARPFAEVTLYAKISGYMKSISVDKGDKVREGQLIAIIQSPELDRQFDAAAADAEFKKANAERTRTLAKSGFVSVRDAELDTSQANVAEATKAALNMQKTYEQLRAPFSGTVTARFADPGALVQSAANAQTSALPVVTIAQIDRLRIYAYVDQRSAAEVHVGDQAEISLPGGGMAAGAGAIMGKVTRLSSQLDARTRMMLIEVDLDNREGRIVPGSFVAVVLTIKTPPSVEVPVEALVIRDRKPFVAGVTADRHVQLRPVTLLAHDGARVRITSGLKAGELVALNVGESIPDGSPIQPMQQPGAATGAAVGTGATPGATGGAPK